MAASMASTHARRRTSARASSGMGKGRSPCRPASAETKLSSSSSNSSAMSRSRRIAALSSMRGSSRHIEAAKRAAADRSAGEAVNTRTASAISRTVTESWAAANPSRRPTSVRASEGWTSDGRSSRPSERNLRTRLSRALGPRGAVPAAISGRSSWMSRAGPCAIQARTASPRPASTAPASRASITGTRPYKPSGSRPARRMRGRWRRTILRARLGGTTGPVKGNSSSIFVVRRVRLRRAGRGAASPPPSAPI
ncbi:hypothetical protein MET9862_02212 [Methylobacterium symbioticum]|uniref:Uncharacterized protein n=1 Tax=Methylobacterium symbioticum TaxID=2584084 RepID=A0A509EDV9_9HYPH|nr:hypothetical protein MET9862_02212 [Methylobacterium symbioticum]